MNTSKSTLDEFRRACSKLSPTGVRRLLAIANALLAEQETGRNVTREALLREAAELGVTMPEAILQRYPSEEAPA